MRRLDTANRSFVVLAGSSLLAGMALCGAVGCLLATLVVSRVARDGLGAAVDGGRWLALVFIGLVVAGLLLGLRSLCRQLAASRRLGHRVRQTALPLPAGLQAAAERAGLAGRVRLVAAPECFSFVYGALTPRVVVSNGLLQATAPEELDAVLAHERYHVRNLDPLKVLISSTVPSTLFYLPALSALHTQYMAGRELAADRRAIDRTGQAPLAGALVKVVGGPRWEEFAAAAAISGAELLDVRIDQLETGAEPRLPAPTRAAVGLSLAAALLLVGAIAAFGGGSALTDAIGEPVRGVSVLAGVACVIPWVAGGWLGYCWLARRSAGAF